MSDAPTDTTHSSQPTAARNIIRAGIVVALAHICLKFVSPLQYIFVGHLCDNVTRDLFVFGFESILMMLFLVGEESLGPALLPVFMQEKEHRGEHAAWSFANTILTAQFLILLLVVALVAIFPEGVAALLTRWDEPGKNPAYMRLAPLYARYIVLGLFGLSLGSTTYMLLNGYKRFFLAAIGDAAFKIGVVAALATAWALHMEVDGKRAVSVFAAGAVAGSAFKLGAHLLGLRDKVHFLRPRLDVRNAATRQFLLLVAPLIVGIVFAKVRDIYNNVLVLSALEEGFMSATAFGRKIYQTISFLGPYAVSIAMLPFFCEMVAREEKDELGDMLTRSSHLILLMCAPLAALVIALSLPIAQVLFQGGEYTYDAAVQAAVANACYTLVLPFAALECVFMQTFFANRRMISVTLLGIIFSALSMAISYWFVIRLGWRGLAGVAAVSLAFTVSRMLKVVTLGIVMRRFIPCFPVQQTVVNIGRILLVAGATGLAAWGTRQGYETFVPVPTAADRIKVLTRVGPELVLAGIVGGLACLAMMFLFCRHDLQLIVDWTLARIRRRDPDLKK